MIDAAIQSIPSSEPFDSLAMLRRQHTVLLSQQRSVQKGRGLSEPEIIYFLGKAKATGRILSAPESRAAVQNILDYWSAVLLSANPALSDQLGALFPDDHDGVSVCADEAAKITMDTGAEDTLETKAKQFSHSLDAATSETLRRLLPKLVRFSAGTDEFYLHALPATDLGGETSDESSLLEKLVKERLVRIEGEGPSRSYVLADAALLKIWPELREICSQRRTFRGLARRWDSGGRKKEALLERGPQLAVGSSYRDLVEYETSFLEFSHGASDHRRKRQLTVLGLLLGLASILAISFGIAVIKLQKSVKALEKANKATYRAEERVVSTEFRLAQAESSQDGRISEILDEVTKVQAGVSTTDSSSVVQELEKIVDVIKEGAWPQGTPPNTDPPTTAPPQAPRMVHPNLTQTAVATTLQDGWQSGKVHLFAIDNDPRIKPTDTLAIISNWREADALSPPVFKTGVKRGPKPLVSQLNAGALFLAARWNYKITPRRWLLENKIEVRNPRTGKTARAQAVDWGPSAKDGHLMDLSPGLANALGLNQGDLAEIKVPMSSP